MRRNLVRLLLLAAGVGALGAPGARADGIVGTWEGTYRCGQGETGLMLIVSPPPRAPKRTLFFFHPTDGNPGVPKGCFEMDGTFNAETGEAEFTAGRWLFQPEHYVTVDLVGTIDAQTGVFAGIVDGPACADFHLSRVRGAPPPIPAECRGAPVADLAR
jgi:hypothetical protein